MKNRWQPVTGKRTNLARVVSFAAAKGAVPASGKSEVRHQGSHAKRNQSILPGRMWSCPYKRFWRALLLYACSWSKPCRMRRTQLLQTWGLARIVTISVIRDSLDGRIHGVGGGGRARDKSPSILASGRGPVAYASCHLQVGDLHVKCWWSNAALRCHLEDERQVWWTLFKCLWFAYPFYGLPIKGWKWLRTITLKTTTHWSGTANLDTKKGAWLW